MVCGLDSISARQWLNGTLVRALLFLALALALALTPAHLRICSCVQFSLVQWVRDASGATVPASGVLQPVLVDGGTEGFKGNVRVTRPAFNACVECAMDLYPPPVCAPALVHALAVLFCSQPESTDPKSFRTFHTHSSNPILLERSAILLVRLLMCTRVRIFYYFRVLCISCILLIIFVYIFSCIYNLLILFVYFQNIVYSCIAINVTVSYVKIAHIYYILCT